MHSSLGDALRVSAMGSSTEVRARTPRPGTIGEAVRAAERVLDMSGCESPLVDAQWIAAHALEMSRAGLFVDADREFPEHKRDTFENLVARRAHREPLAYVLGTTQFRGLDLEVGPGVLVPRPETEVTAGRAIERARARGRATVVDVGTGSAAIALAVAAEVPSARVFATEPSAAARAWALRNLARTGLRATLLPGEMMDPLHPALGGAVDVVVSNPPYIANGDWPGLPPEIQDYEPHEAICGGEDGLDIVVRLLQEAPRWLAIGGWIVIESGEAQAGRLERLLRVIGYTDVLVTKDLAGRNRVVEGRWIGV
jgi:release factor glutamine methyltransferase